VPAETTTCSSSTRNTARVLARILCTWAPPLPITAPAVTPSGSLTTCEGIAGRVA
jgi:hypothetical protein